MLVILFLCTCILKVLLKLYFSAKLIQICAPQHGYSEPKKHRHCQNGGHAQNSEKCPGRFTKHLDLGCWHSTTSCTCMVVFLGRDGACALKLNTLAAIFLVPSYSSDVMSENNCYRPTNCIQFCFFRCCDFLLDV